MGPRVHSEEHKDLNSEGGSSVDKGKVYQGNYAHSSDLKSLTCGMCSQILKTPMQLISCGCRFCSDCIQNYVTKNGNSKLICPTDGEDFSTSQIKKDKGCMKEIDQLLIECQAVTSCGWKGPLSRLEYHVRSCPNEVVTCKNGCGKEFLRCDEGDHSFQCPKRETLCSYCSVKLPHDELDAHYQCCPLHPVECNFCKESILTRSEFSKHLEVCTECELECPMSKMTQCKFVGKRAQMNEHVMANHLLAVVDKMVQQDSSLCSRVETLEASNKRLSDRVDSLEVTNSLLLKQVREKDAKLNVVEKKLERLELGASPTRMLTSHGDYDTQTDGRASTYESTHRGIGGDIGTHRFTKQSSYSRSSTSPDGNESRSLATIPKPVPNAVTHMIKEMVDKHENQIFHLHSEMQTIQQNFNKCSLTLDEMKLRQDIQDVRTSNGVFIWKIPDIRRRYRDALEGKTVSLYSPPFRTSPHGYRMCMRLYLNGDGTGKGTYISLFFVLMRSEHDDLLPFPFRQSVRFTLLNQVTRSDSISEAFAPDLNSQSFQRPKSDMNVASGFPRFARQAVLHDENFTRGNAIYIKAQVDLAGLTLE